MVTTTATALAPGIDHLVSRRETLEHWGEALVRGDDEAVARLVRQSRMDRIWISASGQLGTMLG
jgi:hypothetical protein